MKTTGRLAHRFAALGFAVVAAASLAAPLEAQGYFGQNQVQYDRLRWRVIETEHFLVHYYPEIADVAPDAARMAERSYARLSRLMAHQFREKKPILIFGSSGDFAQSNVFGDLGEGTGGVTDPLRQRMAQFFTGDWGSFEHVLQHEMVHVFQFDIFSRGRAGSGLQNLATVNPPLWFMEGLAEYFSIGDKHPWTDAWVRDAVVNGTLPSIRQMTERPDKYFPYRYGLSVWQYVGARWGDEAIGEIMNAIPSLGIDRAFRREIGMTTDELSEEWKQAMSAKFLPVIATLDRPRSFSEPLLSQRRANSIASLFVAPALSNDGKLITYIAYGSLLRGEVFPDLYLANAETGKRIARLVKTSTNPDFEQLRFIYSQPSFSPDGSHLAFTGQRGGRDVLYLMDVKSRRVIKRFDFELDQVLSPSFSPDGRRIVFSGMKHGMSDLYVASLDSPGYQQLTKDQYGDLQPQWSPDGKTIAFASDRGEDTDFDILKVGKWKVSLYDTESGTVSVIPGQASGTINSNPQWAPDGKTIAYLTDRTGIANLFLYDLAAREHYQLTNVAGAITAVAEYSPAITWARGADVLAYVYYEKGEHSIWKIKDPRSLKKAPFRETITAVASGAAGSPLGITSSAAAGTPPLPVASTDPAAHLPSGAVRDSTAGRTSTYRSPTRGARVSSELPAVALSRMAEQVSVRALMDSFDFNLPDTTRFRDGRYKVRLTPEYVAQPSIGYQQGGFGQGTYGGTTIVLSDLLGDHRLALSGSINGQLADATVFAGYTSLGRRLQYTTGIAQQPVYLLSNSTQTPVQGSTDQFIQSQEFNRLVIREVFAAALYPLNRFTRWELGARFNNVDQQVFPYQRIVDYRFGVASAFERGPTRNVASANTVSPYLAFVTDNSLFGYTGPISGRRARFSAEPSVGTWNYTDYLADARSYIPILFNYITFATRFTTNLAVGRDEGRFPKWIGRPDFIRGYNRDDLSGIQCSGLPNDDGSSCNTVETIGSRVAFANAELRFPIIRRLDLGFLPMGLPPLDGLVFYDAGVAWSSGQDVMLKRPANYDFSKQRALLRSYGFGLRLNLFNIAIVRWDYAIPQDRPGQKGFGTWFFGASY
jgi:Tol biopolymer transport system component